MVIENFFLKKKRLMEKKISSPKKFTDFPLCLYVYFSYCYVLSKSNIPEQMGWLT